MTTSSPISVSRSRTKRRDDRVDDHARRLRRLRDPHQQVRGFREVEERHTLPQQLVVELDLLGGDDPVAGARQGHDLHIGGEPLEGEDH